MTSFIKSLPWNMELPRPWPREDPIAGSPKIRSRELEIKCRAKREKPDEPLENQDYSPAGGALRLTGRQLQPDF
jgi:hypothetical protein